MSFAKNAEGIVLSFLSSNTSCRHWLPSSCGMFAYAPVISAVTRQELSGNF